MAGDADDRAVIGYGAGPCTETGDLATEAVTVMAVGIVSSWKMPLAYFLTSSRLKAVQQQEV